MDDDADLFAIFGFLGVGLALALVALLGSGGTTVLLVVGALLSAFVGVMALAIARQRHRPGQPRTGAGQPMADPPAWPEAWPAAHGRNGARAHDRSRDETAETRPRGHSENG